eukprot:4446055-Pleurochrysis_carterae.AAC.1
MPPSSIVYFAMRWYSHLASTSRIGSNDGRSIVNAACCEPARSARPAGRRRHEAKWWKKDAVTTLDGAQYSPCLNSQRLAITSSLN